MNESKAKGRRREVDKVTIGMFEKFTGDNIITT